MEKFTDMLEYKQHINEQLEQKTQRDVIHTISSYGILISVSYGFLYLLISFYTFMFTTFAFATIYLIIFILNNKNETSMRPLSVIFMLTALVHTSLIGLVFVPATTGLHLWGLIIPLFCIITIDYRDVIWTGLFSMIACALIVYLEWNKHTYVPPLQIDIIPEILPFIRAVTMLTIVLFVSGVFWFYDRKLASARQALQHSYRRSESLLLNILPEVIAHRLKQKSEIIADDIDEASVLFCDIVGFTAIASQQTALQTVKMLNGIFIAFDEAIDKRNLEKIKTIGDAYMVASGVPKKRTDHAAALIHLALDFFQILEKYNDQNDTQLSLRVGINCGPLTAGVIGKRKFSYDLWGDTVNVASRMESTGIPNRIQVTESFANETSDLFRFDIREEVYIKGKGMMKTFLYAESTSSK